MACLSPFLVNDPNSGERSIPVDCGKCPPCLHKRVSGWAFRLLQQDKISLTSYFLTITYSTDTVPISNKGFMTLNKKDVQLFLKRLRKRSPDPIKYYYCGEYGGQNMRPHYHLIIFNAKPADIELSWHLGTIHYGQVSGASIAYTLKYMTKPKQIPLHHNDDRIPEFSHMSKGLGVNYLTPSIIKYHTTALHEHYHLTLPDGYTTPLPRYYKNKLYTSEEQEYIAYQCSLKALESKQLYQEKMIQLHGDNWENIQTQIQIQATRAMHEKTKLRNKI